NNLPRKVVGNDLARGPRVQRILRLSAQIDRQFLEDLSADDTRPRLPQIFYERLRTLVLLTGGGVVGVHEDVRVDEALIAHGVRRVISAASTGGRGLPGGAQGPVGGLCQRSSAPARSFRVDRSGER